MNGGTIFKLNKIQVITYFPKHTFNDIYQFEEFFIEHTFIPYLDSFANILAYFIYINISLHLSSHGFGLFFGLFLIYFKVTCKYQNTSFQTPSLA